jgi:hypothetical protein
VTRELFYRGGMFYAFDQLLLQITVRNEWEGVDGSDDYLLSV